MMASSFKKLPFRRCRIERSDPRRESIETADDVHFRLQTAFGRPDRVMMRNLGFGRAAV